MRVNCKSKEVGFRNYAECIREGERDLFCLNLDNQEEVSFDQEVGGKLVINIDHYVFNAIVRRKNVDRTSIELDPLSFIPLLGETAERDEIFEIIEGILDDFELTDICPC